MCARNLALWIQRGRAGSRQINSGCCTMSTKQILTVCQEPGAVESELSWEKARFPQLNKQPTQPSIDPGHAGLTWNWEHGKAKLHHVNQTLTVCQETGAVDSELSWEDRQARFPHNGKQPTLERTLALWILHGTAGGTRRQDELCFPHHVNQKLGV